MPVFGAHPTWHGLQSELICAKSAYLNNKSKPFVEAVIRNK